MPRGHQSRSAKLALRGFEVLAPIGKAISVFQGIFPFAPFDRLRAGFDKLRANGKNPSVNANDAERGND